ncbi:Amyloid-like protein 2-like [Homarus americanus]|uniref:Amyloid-like protein 2-like n=2 Tax=Homarus americanus TaxID=6706 RepID=A0A8J5TBC0_HOMAM|nr:Amyloid-like protein 2-like [Homarus americanus]
MAVATEDSVPQHKSLQGAAGRSSPYGDRSLTEQTTGSVKGRCNQQMLSGMCRAYIRRWYYDATIGDCKKFIYGGCQGNENNFLSRQHCRAACPDEVTCPEDSGRTCLVSESLCINTTCSNHSDSVCRVTPCTCDVHYFDELGKPVKCEELPGQATTDMIASTPATSTFPMITDSCDVDGCDEDESDPWLVYVVVVLLVLMLGVTLVLCCRRRGKGSFYIIFVPSPLRETGDVTTSPTCLAPFSHTQEKFTESSLVV